MEKTSAAERLAIQEVFGKFDADGSGTMDVSELSAALQHLGISVDEEQLSVLVQQVDVNSRDEMSLEGFVDLITLLKAAARYQLVGSSLRTKSVEYLQRALYTKLLSSDAIWRFFFDGIVMLTAYALSVILVLDSVIPVTTTALAMQVTATVIFFADVMISAFTHRESCKVEDTQIEDTLWSYAADWLAPDVFATLPWGLILENAAPAVGNVMRHFCWVVKVMKMPQMFRHSGKSVMTEQYINYYFKVLPIATLIALFGFMVHIFTVIFVALKQSRGEASFTYDQALYFVIYTLCTVGFGDPPVIHGTIEQLYACLVLCGAILCNGYIIATFVAILQRADIHQDRRGKLRETLAVLEHFSMPPALQDEVLQFQDHLLGHSLSSAYASVVEGLPLEMRNNIDVAVKLRMVDTAPFLAELHDLLRIAIAKGLVNAVAKPEQNLFVQGEYSVDMVFISHGLVDLIQPGGGRHTKMRTGQYFGVSALLQRPRSGTMSAGSSSAASQSRRTGLATNQQLPETSNNSNADDDPSSRRRQQQSTAAKPGAVIAAGSSQNNKATAVVARAGGGHDADHEDDGDKSDSDPRRDDDPRQWIVARHNVSAKAMSYCDLWRLSGRSVVEMGRRFVRVRSLLSRLAAEFKVNPKPFECFFSKEDFEGVQPPSSSSAAADTVRKVMEEARLKRKIASTSVEAEEDEEDQEETDVEGSQKNRRETLSFAERQQQQQQHPHASTTVASTVVHHQITASPSTTAMQSPDSWPTSVRVHNLTERLRNCHSRTKDVLLAMQALQAAQQHQQQHHSLSIT